MSDLLQSKLAIVRRKRTIVHVLTGIATVVALVVLVTMATAMLDWWLNLSYATRAVIFALELAAVIVLLLKLAIWPVLFGPDEETLALSVEREWPQFRSRLISAIQLVRPQASPAGTAGVMVTQLVRETEQIANEVDFGAVVKTKHMARIAALAVAILAAGGAATAYGESSAVALIKRALLIPGIDVPRKTRVIINDGDRFVAKGDSVTLNAIAEGVQPLQGVLTVTGDSGSVQTYTMEPDGSEAKKFVRTLDAVPNSFTYSVRLNDGVSAEYKVSTTERPAVAAIDVRQIYPAYTGLAERAQSQGDMRFLAGSRMVLNVTATKKLFRPSAADEKSRRSVVRLIGANVEYPLTIDLNDPTKATASEGGQPSIPLPPGTKAFRVELVDDTLVTSKNETEYRIDIAADRAPTLVVTSPLEREVLVTPKGQIDVGFDVTDDFALTKLVLKHRVLPTVEDSELAEAAGLGLTAIYYDQPDLTGRTAIRVDGKIDNDFGNDPPTGGFPADNWSARWAGQLTPKESGRYVFNFAVDDGVRLWVDNKQLLDKWMAGDFTHDSEPILLEANKPVAIRVEYYEQSGPAHITMSWKREGGPAEVVPTDVLLSLEGIKKVAADAKLRQEKSIDLDIGSTPRHARGFYPWKVSSLGAAAPTGTSIEWWLEARDGNNVTGPGVTSSERYVFRVVTEEEKRAELMSRLGDYMGEIDTVQRDQTDLSTKLGTMVQEKPIAPKNP